MSKKDTFIPIHRTKILLLRWIANDIFHNISMIFFKIGLRANDDNMYGGNNGAWNRFKESFGWNLYKVFNYPYDLWGTVYILKDDISKNLGGSIGDDYDSNGIPYWDYFMHHDPETGDAWRLLPNKEKLHEILTTPALWEDVRDGEIIPQIQKEIK